MKVIIKKLITFIVLLFVIWAPAMAIGKINYTALLNQNGNRVSGNKNVVFKIYDRQTGGNLCWTSGSQIVNIANGRFNYILGQDKQIDPDIFVKNSKLYLEITVEDETLLPREELLKTPYAEIAGSVYWENIDGIPENIKNQQLPVNSIGSYQIIDSTITTSKIADDAITTSKIADGNVTSAKIASLAWSKLTDIPANFGGAETDPLFVVSASSGIVSRDIDRWNLALQPNDNISRLTNDALYLTTTSISAEYAKTVDVANAYLLISSASLQYATKEEVAEATTSFKVSLSTVATTGDYKDLIGKPTAVSAFENDALYVTTTSISEQYAKTVDVANAYLSISSASLQYATKEEVAEATTSFKVSLSTVATTGKYTDLIGIPTAVSAFVNDALYLTTASISAEYAKTVDVANAYLSISSASLQYATKDEVFSSTTSLRTDLEEIRISTGSLQAQISAIDTTNYATRGEVFSSTTSLRADLEEMRTSTGSLQAQISAIDFANYAIKSEVYSSTTSLRTDLDELKISTGAIKTSLDSIIESTGNLKIQMDSFSTTAGDLQSKIENIAISTGILQSEKVSANNPTFTGNLTVENKAIFSATTKTLSSDEMVDPTNTFMRIQGAFSDVFINKIKEGINGQILILQGGSNENRVTFQDSRSVFGSGIYLNNGESFTIGEGDSLLLIFYANQWHELLRSDN
jgi:hypothetical protein